LNSKHKLAVVTARRVNASRNIANVTAMVKNAVPSVNASNASIEMKTNIPLTTP
jgi:hypothetical protein